MITFEEYLERGDDDPCYELVDPDSCPTRVRKDYWRRNENVVFLRPLCKGCDGTGNMFMYAYKTCDDCGGYGFMV